jgi:hypothetical protein
LKFQPWLWDNTKLFSWSYFLLAIPVARYLFELLARPRLAWRFAAVALFVLCTASGFLDLIALVRSTGRPSVMWDAPRIELARRFREISSPTDRVLASDYHHHWVASLAGRQVLVGYRGWLGSYGIDFEKVFQDVKRMYSGAPDSARLIRRYGVRYIVVGPEERQDFSVDSAFFERNYPKVLEYAGYQIYRVPGGSGERG